MLGFLFFDGDVGPICLFQESKEARKETAQMQPVQNGGPPGLEDGPGHGHGHGHGLERHAGALSGAEQRARGADGQGAPPAKGKRTLKSTATAAKFVASLSPKSARKQAENRTTLTKVKIYDAYQQLQVNLLFLSSLVQIRLAFLF